MYKGPRDRHPRLLRRLWKLKIYVGDEGDPGRSIREETVIAFNAVEAIRRARGAVAEQPEAVCYVTWDGEPLRIENTGGPTDEVIEPTIATPTTCCSTAAIAW